MSESPRAIEFDHRGFGEFGEFRDERGVTVRVKESSAAGGPRIWVFVNCMRDDYRQDGAAHLTLDDARRLRDMLNGAVSFMEQRDRDWLGEDEVL
jgi:hypothetical protein